MRRILTEIGERHVSYRAEDDRPRPVVIHVPGFNEDALSHAPYGVRLAAAGFHCLQMEPPWRATPNLTDPSPAALFDLLDEADGIFSDLLEQVARPGEGPDWLAYSGFSMGGMFVARRLAERAEPAVRAAVLVLSSGDWRFLPGTAFDAFPALAARVPDELKRMAEEILAAGSPMARIEQFPSLPLLMLNADQDPWLPLASARRFHLALRERYEREGRAETLCFEVHQGERHEFRRAMQRRARDWLLETLESTIDAHGRKHGSA